MQNNIDGDYIVARDWDHAVNGQKLGLRSLLKIKRLKMIADIDLCLEFVGTPVTLEMDGKTIDSFALRCTGLSTDILIDRDALKRVELAEAMASNTEMSLSALAQKAWRNKGGNQIETIERVVPEEWIGVMTSSGEMREFLAPAEYSPKVAVGNSPLRCAGCSL